MRRIAFDFVIMFDVDDIIVPNSDLSNKIVERMEGLGFKTTPKYGDFRFFAEAPMEIGDKALEDENRAG